MMNLFPENKKHEDIALRPYQEEAVNALREHFRQGKKNLLLCASTGSGKTIIAVHLIHEALKKKKRCLFICDQVNLIDQTSMTLDRYGIEHGIIQGKHWRTRPFEWVQVASAQTLARREWPEVDLIIIDECHILYKSIQKKILQREIATVGLTATPFTKGLGKIYDAMVTVTTTQKLIDAGFLSNFKIFSPSEPDMMGVKVTSTGEWDVKETSDRALKVVGDCVTEYLRHGMDRPKGRKFICSAVDIKHAKELSNQFLEKGIATAVYTADVPDEVRKEIVEEFRKPDSLYRGLITVMAATKGFDVPDVEMIIMARPLRNSVAQYIQLFGRGLRIAPDKKDCIILDHSGNSMRFKDIWIDFFDQGIHSLDDSAISKLKKKPKKKEAELMTCPKCKHWHKKAPFCPECNYEYPRSNRIISEDGILKEMMRSGKSQDLSIILCPYIKRYVMDFRRPEIQEKSFFAIYKGMVGHNAKVSYKHVVPSKEIPELILNRIKKQNWLYFNRKSA